MDSYHLRLEDLQTSVDGEIDFACGTYIEEFQEQGRSPERARGRFSKVLTDGADGQQVLLYHREIQPFDRDDRYLRSLTAIE